MLRVGWVGPGPGALGGSEGLRLGTGHEARTCIRRTQRAGRGWVRFRAGGGAAKKEPYVGSREGITHGVCAARAARLCTVWTGTQQLAGKELDQGGRVLGPEVCYMDVISLLEVLMCVLSLLRVIVAGLRLLNCFGVVTRGPTCSFLPTSQTSKLLRFTASHLFYYFFKSFPSSKALLGMRGTLRQSTTSNST